MKQVEVEIKVERRSDSFHLSLKLSLNLPESWRTFSASCWGGAVLGQRNYADLPARARPVSRQKTIGGTSARYAVAGSTSFAALAARLFFRLLQIVLSMIAPQLIHFQA